MDKFLKNKEKSRKKGGERRGKKKRRRKREPLKNIYRDLIKIQSNKYIIKKEKNN